MYPTPMYPTGPATGAGKAVGTGLPSVSLVIEQPTSSAAGVSTSAPVPTSYKGAGSRVCGSMGVMFAVGLGAMALLI